MGGKRGGGGGGGEGGNLLGAVVFTLYATGKWSTFCTFRYRATWTVNGPAGGSSSANVTNGEEAEEEAEAEAEAEGE